MINNFQFINGDTNGDKQAFVSGNKTLYNKLSAQEANLIKQKINEIIQQVNAGEVPLFPKFSLKFKGENNLQTTILEVGDIVHGFYDAETIWTNAVYNGGDVNDKANYTKLDEEAPTDYAKIVYFNSTNPTTATVFDDVNPPLSDNPLLKENTDNLYISSDNSTWIYNGTVYSTKVVPSSSNFYIDGTNTDAGNNKTSAIKRTGGIIVEANDNAITGIGTTAGVYGYVSSGDAGVYGHGESSNGVWGSSDVSSGVFGSSNSGIGVKGYSNGSVAGEFGIGALNTGKIATFKKGNIEVASISGQGHIINALIPKEISGTYTLLAEDAGRSFIITANTTVTIPNGLPAGFNAGFSTLAGAVLTFTLGVSVIVPVGQGLVMQADSDCAIVPRLAVNSYLIRGAV